MKIIALSVVLLFIFVSKLVYWGIQPIVVSHFPVDEVSFHNLFDLGMFEADHELDCTDDVADAHVLPNFNSIYSLGDFHLDVEQYFKAIKHFLLPLFVALIDAELPNG